MVGAHTRGGKSYHISATIRKISAKLSKFYGRGGLEETDHLLRKLRSQYAETILITQELSENLQNSRSEARRNQIPHQNVRSSPNIEEDNQQSGDPVVPARESQVLNLQAPRNTPSLSRQFSEIATDRMAIRQRSLVLFFDLDVRTCKRF